MSDKEKSSRLAAALAEAQEELNMESQAAFVNAMVATCTKRCLSTPEPKLSDRSRRCMDMCAGAFMNGFSAAAEAMSSISKKAAEEQ